METSASWKKISIAFALTGLLLVTSACGGESDVTPSPVASSTSATSQPPATVPTNTADSHDSTIEDGPVIKTSKGDYTQIKLPANSLVFKYNPDITSPSATALYSEAEITEAQKFIANFVSTEVIDTPLNGNAETIEQWWERNESKLSPAVISDAKESLGKFEGTMSNSIVAEEPWQQDTEKQDYSYVYKAGVTRVSHLELKPTKVFADDGGGLAVQMDVSYQMPYNSSTVKAKMYVSGSYIFSAKKDANNEWQINGYRRTTTTQSQGIQ